MPNLGTKALNLIRIRDEFKLPVPDFITVEFELAFTNFDEIKALLEKEINRFLKNGMFPALKPKPEFNTEYLNQISSAAKNMGFTKVSFRTSAAMEDGPGLSFAGQYESFLDQDFSLETLKQHLLLSFASLYSERVVRYARSQQLTTFEVGGSMIIQEMFYGDISGVAFSEDGSGNLAIHFNRDWRNHVVDGANAEELHIPRAALANSRAPKQMIELCQHALLIESSIKHPVDLEFAYNDNRLVLLQFRPVTAANLDFLLDWDSTNISENYPGVTLPLTYSSICKLYAGVYPAFLRLLGAKESVITNNSQIFDNMLGYLNGHVYYRMSSWYEGLKLLPGRRNQEYFESMLNPVTKRGASKYSDGLDLKSVATLFRFGYLVLTSERRSRKFRDYINERIRFFESYQTDYLSAESIINASKQIRVELLSQWAVPILNDIKLMIFHGILKNVFFKGDHQAEYLDFLQGLTDRASIKPLQALASLGKVTREALASEKVSTLEALKNTESWKSVREAAENYNFYFGARTPDELKLENQRFTDEVTSLLTLAIKATEQDLGVESGSKTKWPAHVAPLLRPALSYVANNTRRAIDWRERFRFNRAQTFNLSRTAINSLSKILVSEGVIRETMDIYWLTENELDEIVNGHAWSLEAKNIISDRKKALKQYEGATMELAVRGSGRLPATNLQNVTPKTSETLSGNGVARGELTAEVVVAKVFDPNLDVRGKILVVPHVDPGWTLLFTQAAGIIAERGNALSHAAIIAREIGIPAIVDAVGATEKLSTGQTISINGITGEINHGKN